MTNSRPTQDQLMRENNLTSRKTAAQEEEIKYREEEPEEETHKSNPAIIISFIPINSPFIEALKAIDLEINPLVDY